VNTLKTRRIALGYIWENHVHGLEISVNRLLSANKPIIINYNIKKIFAIQLFRMADNVVGLSLNHKSSARRVVAGLQVLLTNLRFMGNSVQLCNGVHIGQEVCVLLSDFSCVACEEIEDPCVCITKEPFC
jgi:hypothetical protein